MAMISFNTVMESVYKMQLAMLEDIAQSAGDDRLLDETLEQYINLTKQKISKYES